jgi:hypothetical protein
MALGAMVASEAWQVLTGSLERAVEQNEKPASLRGMSDTPAPTSSTDPDHDAASGAVQGPRSR